MEYTKVGYMVINEAGIPQAVDPDSGNPYDAQSPADVRFFITVEQALPLARSVRSNMRIVVGTLTLEYGLETMHTHESSEHGKIEHSHLGGYYHAHYHTDRDSAPVWFCGCPMNGNGMPHPILHCTHAGEIFL